MTGKTHLRTAVSTAESKPETLAPTTDTPTAVGLSEVAERCWLAEEWLQGGNFQNDFVVGPDGAGRPAISSLILSDSAIRHQLISVLAEMLRAVLAYPTPEVSEEDTAEN